MITQRIGVVQRSGGSALPALRFASSAERKGCASVWVGWNWEDINDRYVIATASAIAARTRNTRVGVVLHALEEPVRLAEDLAVLDHIAQGRVDVIVQPSPHTDQPKRLQSLISAWQGITTEDRELPVTPPPMQPVLPVLVAEPDRASAAPNPVTAMTLEAVCSPPDGPQRRAAAVLGSPAAGSSVAAWALKAQTDDVLSLRRLLHERAVTDVVVEINEADPVEPQLTVIQGILRPVLCCARHEVELLLPDARSFLEDESTQSVRTWMEATLA